MESSFFDTDAFTFIGLPILIFLARICDVTIGTLRIIFVSKGKKLLAPLLGFFEVLIWLIAISKIMQNLDNVFCYITYAAGFATGNYIGMLVEEKLAIGVIVIRIITQKNASALINSLHSEGYGVTSIDAQGSKEKVHVIYSIVQRNDIEEVVDIIKKFNPKAFYSVEDVRFAKEGIFPLKRHHKSRIHLLRRWKKGK